MKPVTSWLKLVEVGPVRRLVAVPVVEQKQPHLPVGEQAQRLKTGPRRGPGRQPSDLGLA